MIVAIDPGSYVGCGVALFRPTYPGDPYELRRAYFVPRAASAGFVALARDVARSIDLPNREPLKLRAGTLVVETPQIYMPGRGSKGDPNGLVRLALLVGALAATIPHEQLVTPLPAAWKGQTPKPISHRRALWQLSPAERLRVEKRRGARTQGDVLDAVALGLWHCFKSGKRARVAPEPGEPIG